MPRTACEAYLQCVRKNPRFAEAWNNLGVSNERVGNYTGAVAAYQKAAALGDKHGRENCTELSKALAESRAAQAASGGGRDLNTVPNFHQQSLDRAAFAYRCNHPEAVQSEAHAAVGP